jgi:4-amino-4-deoxy-L-arabinose transferase-like glycosyltransferase
MAEITKDTRKTQSSIGRSVWFLFILLVIFTYFFGLTIPLLGPDEPRYAQIAREMLDRHDWITPTLGGFTWFEKPALLYWLEAASYKIFGVSEFAARFGSAIFGLGTTLTLWLLGTSLRSQSQRTTVDDQRTGSEFAKWLVMIAASTIGIIVFARGASFDIILTLPMTAALVSFFIADRSERFFAPYYLPLGFFYFFIGVALLAKGLVGIVFPIAIVGFYFVISRRFPTKEFIFSLFWGTIIWLGVASIWYLPVYWRHGYQFIDEFFIQHHFQRFTSNKYQHPQPFYFFFWVLPLMTIPWLPFFLASIWNSLQTLLDRRGTETRREESILFFSPLRLFAIAWIAVPLVFFSFSGSKLPGYILPSVPATIILTAQFVSGFVSRKPAWKMPLIGVAFTTLIAVCILIQFVVPKFADEDSVKALISAADAGGNNADKIFSLHTISHNAEFYGAGRLERTDDGKQRRFNGVPELVEEMKREGLQQAVVLMPIAYTKEIPVYKEIDPKVIADNGELVIVRFVLK